VKSEKVILWDVFHNSMEEFPASNVCKLSPNEGYPALPTRCPIDESGEDYLHACGYFVSMELPQETKRALMQAFDRI
jgi:hypothetical protein